VHSSTGSYDVNSLVTDVLGSLSFVARQMGGATIDEVVVSGSVQDDSLLTELARRLPYRVTYFDALAKLDLSGTTLDESTVGALRATGLLAVGAAEWVFEPSARRISLLPAEVRHGAAARRLAVLCGVAGLVVVVALGGLTWHNRSQVNKEKKVATELLTGNDSLQGKIASLAPLSTAHAAVASRVALLKAAEANDIAWSPLLAEIANAMPAGTTLTNISFTDASGGSSGSGASGSSSATSAAASSSPEVVGSLGSVTMSVQGTGTEDEVAVWLRALSKVKGLTAVWVPAGSDSGGKVTFSSSASVTSGVPLVHRGDVTSGAAS
jgi:Tfp pilus assembly protein PilN